MTRSKSKRKKAYTTPYKRRNNSQSQKNNNLDLKNKPTVTDDKSKKSTIKKLKIPIVGILSILMSYYFLLEPKIKLAQDQVPQYTFQTENFGDSISMMYVVTVPLINTSFKNGFVNRVEVLPNGIKFLPYTVKSIEIDKDWIPYKQIRQIRFQVTVNYSKEGSSLRTNNVDINNFPGLRFQLFDNKNNPVLETNEKSNWFIILIGRNFK